jgi:hypothetical protein
LKEQRIEAELREKRELEVVNRDLLEEVVILRELEVAIEPVEQLAIRRRLAALRAQRTTR